MIQQRLNFQTLKQNNSAISNKIQQSFSLEVIQTQKLVTLTTTAKHLLSAWYEAHIANSTFQKMCLIHDHGADQM